MKMNHFEEYCHTPGREESEFVLLKGNLDEIIMLTLIIIFQ